MALIQRVRWCYAQGRFAENSNKEMAGRAKGHISKSAPHGQQRGAMSRNSCMRTEPLFDTSDLRINKVQKHKEKLSVGPGSGLKNRDNLLSGPTCSVYLSHLLSCFYFLPCFGFLPLFYKAWDEMHTYHLWFNWKLINGHAINHWNKHTKDELILWVTQTCW